MDMFRITMPSPQSLMETLGAVAAAVVDGQGVIIACSVAFAVLMKRPCEPEKTLLAELLSEKQDVEALVHQYREAASCARSATVTFITGYGERLTVDYALYDAMDADRRMYVLTISGKPQVATGEQSLLQRFAGTFVKDVNLGVLLVDQEFRLVEISELACSLLGIERQQVLTRSMDDIFQTVPKEHRLVQRTLLEGVLVRNHAVSWTNNRERYELLMDSNLLRDEAGAVVGAYVLFKDVTNLRSLEQQVQRSDRLAMIGQIAAGTAHEIRNPLTSIKGFLQVLHRTFADTGMEREQGYTELMLGEIDRINELVNEFLLLSKPKDVVYDKVDMSSVVRDILPIINNQAVLHNVTIQYQSVYQIPKIIADRELLKQVFINLCKNGIEAMVQGGTLTIVEKVDYKEKNVLIEVQDAGPGIPAFLIDKIFDPFFTTKDTGTGLGLSVCQRIIHDLGGSIRVSSKGFGTTFTVSLPFAPS